MGEFLLWIFIGGGLVGGWIGLLAFCGFAVKESRKVRAAMAADPAKLPPVDPTPYTSGADERPLRIVTPLSAKGNMPCSVCPTLYDPQTRPVDRFRYLACSDTCCRVVESRFDIERLAVDLPEETS